MKIKICYAFYATICYAFGKQQQQLDKEETKNNSGISLIPPSRPPAPRLSSSDYFSITISIHLDPNDDSPKRRRNTRSTQVSHYEVQFENQTKTTFGEVANNGGAIVSSSDCSSSRSGIWNDLGLSILPSNSIGKMTSATLKGIELNVGYRFRVRALNPNGSSPWSAPSQILKPKSSLPLPPSNLHLIEKGKNYVELSWGLSLSSFHAHNSNNKTVSSVGKTAPLYYHIQYRKYLENTTKTKALSNNVTKKTNWINYPDFISAILSSSIPEIQEITTLVDPHSKITQGYFWIQLRIPNEENNQRIQPEFKSMYISKKIPFDATAEQFQHSLQVIHGIGSIRVYRYGPNFNSSTDLSNNGAYTWKVEFISPGYESPLPLMALHKNTLNGMCSSSFGRVQVRRFQMGQPTIYKSTLSERIRNLDSDMTYDFRVRGKNEYDQLGAWSDMLMNVSTLAWSDDNQSGLNISEYSEINLSQKKEEEMESIIYDWTLKKPQISSVSHETAMVIWHYLHPNHNFQVKAYYVEISNGRIGAGYEEEDTISKGPYPGYPCSEEYQSQAYLQLEEYKTSESFILKDLHPETVYCVRIVAISNTLEDTLQTMESVFVTLSIPVNQWRLLSSPSSSSSSSSSQQHDLNSSIPLSAFSQQELCGSSSQNPFSPAARRGHSLTEVNASIYLFGGYTEVCTCSDTKKTEQFDRFIRAYRWNGQYCQLVKSYSNDLWHWNTSTMGWSLISPKQVVTVGTNSTVPQGREQHSAVGIPQHGTFRIMGGISYRDIHSDENEILGDMWEFNISSTTWKKIDTNSCDKSYYLDIKQYPELIYDNCHYSTTENVEEDKNIFMPRYSTTMIIIHDDLYVFGGHGLTSSPQNKPLTRDIIWKMNVNDNKWFQLRSDFDPTTVAWSSGEGVAATLTPWGILAFGGLRIADRRTHQNEGFSSSGGIGSEMTNNVWKYNVISRIWQISTSPSSDTIKSNYYPQERYLSAVAFIKGNNVPTSNTSYVIQYAGDTGSSSSETTAEYHLKNDLWLLSLQGLDNEEDVCFRNYLRKMHCDWRKKDELSTFQQTWKKSCGASYNSSSSFDDDDKIATICHWQDIIFMAWCFEQYQSFTFSLG